MSIEGSLFAQYSKAIANLPARSQYAQNDLLIRTFLLNREGRLSVYYAPFDYINQDAKVVLVGITPGWTQMEIAFREARVGIRHGDSPDQIMARIKGRASFAGPMRTHLLSMLDGIGLSKALGITSTRALFEDRSHLVHTTSALRYPVFVDGTVNYTGHTPKIMRTPSLLDYVRSTFVQELNAVPDALVVPLGDAVQTAVDDLVARGSLDARRCLKGFPHPSGGNGHRKRQFLERQSDLSAQVANWFGA